MAATLAAQASAPHRPALLEALRRTVGADPLVDDAHEPYLDAVGQREVGRRLGVLRHRSGPTAPWHLVHDVPLSTAQANSPGEHVDPVHVDHVLVGPGGVYAVTVLHLPGARVRAAQTAFVVDGQPSQHLREAKQRALAVHRVLSEGAGRDVPVRAVVVVLGSERLALPLRTADVAVLRAPVLVRWLRKQPKVLDASTAAELAGHLTATAHQHSDAHDSLDGFERLQRTVLTADRLRRAWFVTLAVAASSAVTTVLASLSP
ncbi:Nuclease-related domain-containing protein [Quadrisphaera granulorum]|uniref:Nuclease-like protein n=2 Tax=Quadrisphaera granulorum TaxID=317664 RepID=A0A315ZPB8_9ACTN|nr:nuclease-like protein [Quadrisphaera granulorum]SZE98776.1 Nuclease-related domain-containing protein [Quadrisphaera granulorum]